MEKKTKKNEIVTGIKLDNKKFLLKESYYHNIVKKYDFNSLDLDKTALLSRSINSEVGPEEGPISFGNKRHGFVLNDLVKEAFQLDVIEKKSYEEKMKKNWHESLHEAQKKAFDVGFQEGLHRGLEKGLEIFSEKIKDIIEASENLILAMRGVLPKMVKENEKMLLQLIGRICHKIIKKEIQLHNTYFVNILVDVLDLIEIKSFLKITLNSDDSKALETLKHIQARDFSFFLKEQALYAEVIQKKILDHKLYFETSAAIASGDYIIESDEVSFSIFTQDQVDKIIHNVLQRDM